MKRRSFLTAAMTTIFLPFVGREVQATPVSLLEIEPSLLNGWAAATPASYMRDPFGWVHLQGRLIHHTGSAYSALIFEPGYRPKQELHILCGGGLEVFFHTDGNVAGINQIGDRATVLRDIFLDGISFRAA